MNMLTGLVVVVALAGLGPARETGWNLQDPGFEARSLAELPVLGWYSEDVDLGRLTSVGDEEDELAGERSLRVTLVEPRPEGEGLISVSQTIRAVGEDPLRELEFSIGLRSRGLSELLAHFYVWDEGKVARLLREERIALHGAGWERFTASITVPKGQRELGVFLYMPREKGTLWLDDASLTSR